jgi:cysteine synthase A
VRCLYANQWDNPANARAHFEATGPETYEQLGGKLDAFSCAVGTGGTLTGMGKYFKSRDPQIRICLTDPRGASLFRYFTEGALRAEGSSVSEGIGQGRITGNLMGFKPDMAFEIPDGEMIAALHDLQSKEGLFLGGSSGINVAGAIRVAKELGPGHTVCTVLCDSGSRYGSKLWNPSFLRSKGLQVPEWLDETLVKNKFSKIGLNEAVSQALSNRG